MFDEELIHYRAIKQLLEYLPTLPGEYSAPVFVYAHFISPHPPYIFSPDGKFDPDSDYLSQVEFIDTQIIPMLEKIINASTESPIIILQGDHGNGECSVPILNAYYFPNVSVADTLYPRITPVNTFRVLFNTYFQGDYSLLEDNSFIDRSNSLISHLQGDVPFEFIRCDYDFDNFDCK